MLVGRTGDLGHIYLEQTGGLRLWDAHLESSTPLAAWIPSETDLWLRRADQEARFRAEPKARLNVETLRWQAQEQRARGSAEHALQKGLFAVPFGPAYYRGWIDSQGLPSVALTSADGAKAAAEPEGSPRWATWVAASSSALLLLTCAGAGTMTYLAWRDWDTTSLQAPAARAAQAFYGWQITTFASCGLSAAAAATAVVLAL
jgi:hypothetical protein